jgi:cysteine desulfurase
VTEPVHRQSPLYLDHHATTPVDPRVLEAMLPFFGERWGNASSKDHRFGNDAQNAVEEARRAIANELGARPKEIVFTSGATESNNLAITGLLGGRALSECHVVTTCVEHPAVLDPLTQLEKRGLTVTRLPVDEFGLVDASELEAAICDHTVLVSVMAANNEIGTLQPLREIGDITRAKGILLHTDAAQALGHLELKVDALNVDLLSASAHKLYGPKGVGFLYVSRRHPRVELDPIQFGGGHEHGLRSGTLNVPGIVGMAAALELAAMLRSAETKRLRESVRFGLGRETTRADVEYALGRIQEVALRIRGAHAVAAG